jgi:hypothetical protein
MYGGHGVLGRLIHTTQPYVPEPSAAEVGVAIRKCKVINHMVLIEFQQERFKRPWKCVKSEVRDIVEKMGSK